jgi:23S rRNA pseudouridine1911/1915/1917 synthase
MTFARLETTGARVHEIEVDGGDARLDQYLAWVNLGLSRSRLRQLIAEGQVMVNGAPAKPAHRVRPGDRILVTVPAPRPSGVVAQDINITVVYQDADLVVVDKPAGLSVHPGPGHPDQTLVNGLLALCPDIRGIGGEIRPGIVHRLDKDTSGLLMVAKTQEAHTGLSNQIRDRTVQKGYLALVEGVPSPGSGTVDVPIGRDPRRRTRMAVTPGGRESRTGYRLLEQVGEYSLLELQLLTGRTHQARVHMAWLGHPLLGDALYGKRSPLLDRHFLHAFRLAFSHPATGEPLEFRSPLPRELEDALEAVRSG